MGWFWQVFLDFSPRLALLYARSFWLESEDVDVLSVELELTEWTEGKDALGGWDLLLATPPTDAELLHSEHGTQVMEKQRYTQRPRPDLR